MAYDPTHHKRRSLRLPGYDYSLPGAYFITICTHRHECLFGNIIDGRMGLDDVGRTVHACWNEIPDHFPYVTVDEFVVMPNHVHGIFFIVDAPIVRAKNLSPLQ